MKTEVQQILEEYQKVIDESTYEPGDVFTVPDADGKKAYCYASEEMHGTGVYYFYMEKGMTADDETVQVPNELIADSVKIPPNKQPTWVRKLINDEIEG